jgi:hypothetical protein
MEDTTTLPLTEPLRPSIRLKWPRVLVRGFNGLVWAHRIVMEEWKFISLAMFGLTILISAFTMILIDTLPDHTRPVNGMPLDNCAYSQPEYYGDLACNINQTPARTTIDGRK